MFRAARDAMSDTSADGAALPTLFCRILGPIEIEIDGVSVDLGGPRSRKLLAALSAARGAPVGDAELIDQVWGDAPPGNIPQAMRAIVWRLRAELGPTAGQRYLERSRAGYALTIPGPLTDHGQLPTLVTRGLAHLTEGDPAAAVADLEAAVALWRGEPWEELGSAPELIGIRAKLAELHDVAIEELPAARIAVGDTTRAIAALTEAVVAAPYRERRWELLALGLYRSGRQVEALETLRRVRRLLITEVGIEPGPMLRALEHAILRQDPSLLLPTSVIEIPPGPSGRVAVSATASETTGARVR
ncbi:winged helix-turn-helix domain-containing protein [Nocardia sp. NBC_00508]|uniref:AfsR/SARP family transcriptional regulator n=1 Tax=Nocardia sp. NBC_00508 TaxID=2975992 RepID=UPI002E81E05A|nr:BTAD domain-containing putative transcriptional regulator [Nocardia sp. NBC_00508]WUD66261.1 winged helix-turn-helix domain-containing protein [Nocardia sp. NBC_00508]